MRVAQEQPRRLHRSFTCILHMHGVDCMGCGKPLNYGDEAGFPCEELATLAETKRGFYCPDCSERIFAPVLEGSTT